MVEVKSVNDRVILIKLVIRGSSVNVISSYASQIGLDEDHKKRFLEVLDEVVRGILCTNKLFVEGEFNGHIKSFRETMMMCIEILVSMGGLKEEPYFCIF